MVGDYETLIDFVAGWTSGAISVTLTQPIDTKLTQFQAQAYPLGSSSGGVKNDILATNPQGYKRFRQMSTTSAFNSFKNKPGAVSSLWAGNSALVGAIPFQNALLMAGYGYGKRICELYHPDNVLLGIFVGGCTGGVIQSFIMSPVELIKVNQQVAGKSLSSATSQVATGFLSRRIAWRGLEATLLRDGLPHGVWFVSYEVMKRTLDKLEGRTETQRTSYFTPLFSGAFAAFTAWGVGYPFDIIKTRIQAPGGENKTINAVAKEIINESNGRVLSGLYRGFSLKLAKAVPSSAINFLVYEKVAEALRKGN